MSNVITIAKKEFADLLSSKIIFIVLLVYIAMIIVNIYQLFGNLSVYSTKDVVPYFSGQMLNLLTSYGVFIGVVVGFSAITTERYGNALGTLVAKPLYRDTIINGKLIGAAGFLGCVFALTTVLFFSVFLTICGNTIEPVLWPLLQQILIVYFISMVYSMVFLAISMLIGLIVTDQAFALMLSIIVLFISMIIPTENFAGNITYLFGNDYQVLHFIMGLSPYAMIMTISNTYIDPSSMFYVSSSAIGAEVMKLAVYLVVAVVLDYIVFIRGDIA